MKLPIASIRLHLTSWRLLFLTLAIPWCVGNAEAAAGVKLVAGGSHTCELSALGKVRCWGRNIEGQLGTGTNVDATVPEPLLGLPTISALSAGRAHTCAVSDASGGTVYCWGSNVIGQLGNGTLADSNKPQNVMTGPGVLLTGAKSISAGDHHTCAVKSDGTVACWGDNYQGQLGTGNTNDSHLPQTVMQAPGIPLMDATSIAAGGHHTCALKSDGQMVCWGWNLYGQVGVGDDSPKILHATSINTLSGVTSVSAGYFHTCALTSALKVYCWGVNANGQGGTGNTDGNSIPTAVTSLTAFTQIAAGRTHTCAVSSLGQVHCWGNNHHGEIGIGSAKAGFSSLDPALVPGLASIEGIAAGGDHSCAVQANGMEFCWGGNRSGQLGIGAATGNDQPIPRSIPGLADQLWITAGSYYTCTISSFFGFVGCWGDNRYGQLGNGTKIPTNLFTVAEDSNATVMVDAAYGHTCAVKQDGTVWCWGENGHGQLGTNNYIDSQVPVKVVGDNGEFTGVSKVAVGSHHTCAVKLDQTLWCWGANSYGQLGLGFIFSEKPTPQHVAGLTNVIAVATGYEYTCALTSDGMVRCWGENDDGQLGTGAFDVDLNAPPASPIDGLSGVTGIAAGYRHTCAISSGRVYCWGRNALGQLGTGDDEYSNKPVPVTGELADVIAIDADYGHTCAVRSGGALSCWGYNSSGQLGFDNPTSSVQESPQLVAGLAGVTSVALGRDHTCVLLQDGSVACMGSTHFGQLGNGEFGHNALPLLVAGLFSDGFE